MDLFQSDHRVQLFLLALKANWRLGPVMAECAAMDLFPPLDAFRTGRLDVGGGHSLYWEESGNPRGRPVLFLHGGPGAGTAPGYRRFFDPDTWRIVLFDQRGCGRSTPSASLEGNTTADLIADIEALRQRLGIERWLLFGGSWGSTLALAYGQAHPERVSGFVLRGIFLFRPEEVEWFMAGMGRFFPEATARFLGHLPSEDRVRPLESYHRRLTDADPEVRLAAARVWCGYEDGCARLLPRHDVEMDDAACMAMARIECHYMVHGGFLDRPLLERMPAIRHLPAIIVQGRYDMVCPPASAFDLARAWPGAILKVVPDAGHSAMEPGIRAALMLALERMRALVD